MKKPFVAFALLYLVAAIANAQSLSDVKLGLGLKHITNRYEWNIMVPALEGEYTRKLSRVFSVSGVVGVGLGKRQIMVSSEVDHSGFLSNVDGNIFLSPFGNDKKYNLKLGTGITILYASEWFSGTAYAENSKAYDRLRTGVSIILENEWNVGERGIIGIKTMAQPYLKQEFAASLLFKYGVKI